jgi:hypothetical protein
MTLQCHDDYIGEINFWTFHQVCGCRRRLSVVVVSCAVLTIMDHSSRPQSVVENGAERERERGRSGTYTYACLYDNMKKMKIKQQRLFPF